MPFEIPAPVAELSDDQLATLIASGSQIVRDTAAFGAATPEQVADAHIALGLVQEMTAERDSRAALAAADTARRAELAAFAAGEEDGEEDPADAADAETEDETDDGEEGANAAADETDGNDDGGDTDVTPTLHAEDLIQSATESDTDFAVRQNRYPRKGGKRARSTNSLAGRRPNLPGGNGQGTVRITAAADVPDFAASSSLADLGQVATATINRMKGFSVPHGDGESEDLRKFGVASFRKEFAPEFTLTGVPELDNEIILAAAKEHRLPGGSLTAAGGWCSPSETIYDLCAGETAEGMLSIPEVGISRGGMKTTTGPDFATLYAAIGFTQTESQAISGTTKACYEVACPSFTDYRLDAIGVCIKAPILTNAAYPELVKRVLSGSMMVHQHRVNASVISRIQTALSTALVGVDYSATSISTLTALEMKADHIRQKYRLALNASMEVVAPFWLKGVIRADISARNGVGTDAVTDQMILAHFAARKLNVQWVYDWQDLTVTAVNYPTTADVMIYPAGAFVKGTSDVINLQAVYDAASLATNVYTALFFEEGLLVAPTCFSGARITLAICTSGHTGSANIAQCGLAS